MSKQRIKKLCKQPGEENNLHLPAKKFCRVQAIRSAQKPAITASGREKVIGCRMFCLFCLSSEH